MLCTRLAALGLNTVLAMVGAGELCAAIQWPAADLQGLPGLELSHWRSLQPTLVCN